MKRWADILLSLWILFVSFVYFGGSLVPSIGARTWQLGAVYVIILVTATVYAFLNRSGGSNSKAAAEADPVDAPAKAKQAKRR